MFRKYTFLFFLIAIVCGLQAQPTNDNCSSATPITIPASGNICVNSTLTGATDNGSFSSCETAGSQEVWFSFVATGSTNSIVVSPTGATPAANLVVSMASGNCPATAVNACAASATANGSATISNWIYSPGTQVKVFVSSANNSGGTFQICVTSVTPPPTTGKNCTLAAPLCSKHSFIDTVATGSTGFKPPCFGQPLQQPIIFKFTVGQTGLLNWLATPSCGPPNAAATEFDWAVYDITAGCPGTVVACDYNYTGSPPPFPFVPPGPPTTTPQGMQGGPAVTGCTNTMITGTTGPEICTGVTVTAGNTYIIILDQYTPGSTCSINFNFTGSTFEMAPASLFTISPGTGCGTVTATFNNTSVAATGATPYTWDFGDNTTSTAQNPPPKTYSTVGTYLVSLTTTSASGCTNITSKPVQVFASPTVSVNNASLCSGGSATLTATPSVSGGTYLWSTGANTQSITVSPGANTTYTVTYTSADNCSASATGTVTTAAGFTVNAGPDSTICANQTVLLNGSVSPPGSYTYAWTANPSGTITGANTLNPTITPLANTIYTLAVSDAGGCTITDAVQISLSGVSVPVTATAVPSIVCPGQPVQLDCSILPVTCGASPPCAGNNITNSVGSGTTVQPGTALQPPTLFGNFLKSGRNQMLYDSAELAAVFPNGNACIIKALTFNIAVFNSNAFLQNFTIKMACTNATSLTTWEQNLTTVYTSASPYQPQAGWLNGIALTTPFAWDGKSNLIVDVCWNNPATFGNQNNKAECTNTAFTSYLYAFSSAGDQCGTVNPPTTSTLRPNVKFNYCAPNIANYNIAWTPSSGPNTVSTATIHNPTTNPIATTNYNVTISSSGCAGNGVVTVQVDNSTVSAGPDKNSCPGAQVALTATVTNPVIPGPASFVWTTLAGANVGNTQTVNVSPVVNTTYVVTMNGGACVKRDTINVILGSITPTATPTNVTCFGANNGKIKAASALGTSPFSFIWSPNANTGNVDSAINLPPGNYTVTVSDVNGCSGTAAASITQPTQLTFTPAHVNELCFGGSTGSATVTPAGGTGAYTYAWSNAVQTAANLNIPAANYSVTVRDANQCSATGTIIVTEPQQIVFLPAVIQDVRCFNGSTGSITVSNNGGTGAFTYNWSHNGAVHTATVTGLTAGTFTVTAFDNNQCSVSTTYTVTQPASGLTFGAPVIVNPTCNGYSDGSATVSASGGVGTPTYAWTPSNQTGAHAIGLSAQTYTVVATDDSACTASLQVLPVDPPAIGITGTPDDVSCFGGNDGAIDITVTNGVPALTYAWSCTSATTQDISGLSAGTCIVTVTDANACAKISTFVVGEPPALVLNAPSITDVACFGGNTGVITLHYSGGAPGVPTIVWSPSGPNSVTNSSLVAGTYDVTVTDVNGCSVSASYQVAEPASGLAFGPAVVVDELCNGAATGSITVTVTGGTVTGAYTYAWQPGPGGNSPTASGLTATTYTVTVTDDNGCSLTQTNTVNEPSAVTFGAQTITNVSCFGGSDGSAQITPTGGTGTNYLYFWNNVAGSNPQTGLSRNTYTVVVVDENNCSFTTTVDITEPAELKANPISTDASCFGAPNGGVDANPSGGTSPYTFLWSNGGTTQAITGVGYGLYTVTVTDANSCSTSSGGNVNEPAPLTFVPQVTQVKCVGDQNGTITAFPSGGTPPWSYSATMDWTNFFFPTGPTIEGLASGFYAVIVNDAHGCTVVDTVFVPAPVGDYYVVSTDPTSCFGSDYADGILHITGGPIVNGPFKYGVDGGELQFSNHFYNLKAGTHLVLAVNNFGCDTTLNAVVGEPVDGVTETYPGDTTLSLGESIQLSSSFGPYPDSSIVSYSWSPATGLSCIDCPNPVATPYAKQTQYVLTITYNEHCTASASMTILVDGGQPVYIPNSFSPNGDGNNDVFQIYGVGIKTIDLKVFNRWGEKVYESNNQFEGWDGSYKGTVQNPSVFVYQVDITYLNDKKTSKVGSITLVR